MMLTRSEKSGCIQAIYPMHRHITSI